MKSYSFASTISLLIGWVAAISVHCALSILIFGNLRGGDSWVMAFYSFFFLILANLLFIQWPKRLIINFYLRNSIIKFIMISIIYSLLTFTLLIGWLFVMMILIGNNFGILGYVNAAIIGLGFGVCFPKIWKAPTFQNN